MANGLTVEAPEGAEFGFEEVKTKHGTESLGEVPILVWKDGQKALEYYGAEGIANVLDGTSLRVTFQGIGRRGKQTNKSDDEIAKAQIDFRPGKRANAPSTPQSRAARLAKQAVEAAGEQGSDVEALLQKLISGELSAADVLGAG